MEAQDLAHGLLRSVTTTSVLRDACADCSYVLLLDDIHQEEEESKEDWLKRNYQLFKEYADVISEASALTRKFLCFRGKKMHVLQCVVGLYRKQQACCST